MALLSYRGKPHVGGQGVYVSRLSAALADLGHEVTVLGGPPYPDLDPRVRLLKLASLDIWAPPHPMRKPRAWEIKDWIDLAEHVSFVTGNFSEPMAFSWRAWRWLSARRDDFDLVHDNQTLGWGILALVRQGWPLLETIHHPITVDRRLELAHARTLREQFGKRRWYAFTKMQTQVARRLPRVLTVSESSMADIARDHKVPRDRIRVVPVGVDPELFAPLPEIAREPGRLITTASADVTMKGLRFLLEAIAKLRTERRLEVTIIGKAAADSAASRVIAELELGDAVTFVSDVSDRRIVELYAQSELAVVPSPVRGILASGYRGDVLRRSAGRHHRRGAARGRGHARRDLLLGRARRRRGAGGGDARRARRSRRACACGRRRTPTSDHAMVLATHGAAHRRSVPGRSR